MYQKPYWKNQNCQCLKTQAQNKGVLERALVAQEIMLKINKFDFTMLTFSAEQKKKKIKGSSAKQASDFTSYIYTAEDQCPEYTKSTKH